MTTLTQTATLNGEPLDLSYTDPQLDIFWENKTRFTVVPKGRRFGATQGAMNFIVESMLSESDLKILWIDTVHKNIDLYVQRYAMPILKQVSNDLWKWRMQGKELRVLNSTCDFRSADRPENIEGFGYHIIIMNEAGIILNNRHLWLSSVRPMCMDYKARVWFVGTPKGKTSKRDGKEHEFFTLYKKALQEEETAWQAFQFSTYEGPIDDDEIRELEKDTPGPIVRQEIYGEFLDVGSEEVFHEEWFEILPALPDRKRALQVIQSWDTAFKKGQENDFSACTTWFITPTEHICVDCWYDQVEFPELLTACKEQYALWSPDVVLIEDKASGQSLIQTIRADTRIAIKPVKAETDKYSRACAVAPLVQSGKVKLAPGPWNKHLVDEMTLFPAGPNDDILDTVVQALNHAKKVSTSLKPVIKRKVIRTSKVLVGY